MARRFVVLVMMLVLALMSACTAVQPAAPSAAPSAATDAAATTTEATSAAPEEASGEEAEALSGELIVFAAASLTDAFGEIATDFQALYPGTNIVHNFAGSQQLSQQLGQGAPADVFASANGRQMEVAIESGRVLTDTSRTFVRNRLVVIYPADNPAGIETLHDLAKPGLKLVLAAAEVPVGGYSLDFLNKASATAEFGSTYSETVISNVVSYEENVRSVLSKVILGEADAGIVYTSDVFGDSADQVGQLDIPDELNTVASYPIAVVADSENPALAQAYMDYVLGPEGQSVLASYGFVPTIGTATGEAPIAQPLDVSGKVATPTVFEVADLKALPQVTIIATNRDGVAEEFTGVALTTLLEEVGIADDAETLVFVGGDGYKAEVALADAQADADALIAFDENDSLRNVFPTLAPRNWVKGLVAIEVN